MDKLEKALKSFEDYKKEVGFKKEVINPEDEKKFRELFDIIADKDYAAITLIGSEEDQMCGLVGNSASLVYLLVKGMLSDEDLYHVVQSALLMMQSLIRSADGDGASKAN